jgi:hypothetical protein
MSEADIVTFVTEFFPNTVPGGGHCVIRVGLKPRMPFTWRVPLGSSANGYPKTRESAGQTKSEQKGSSFP